MIFTNKKLEFSFELSFELFETLGSNGFQVCSKSAKIFNSPEYSKFFNFAYNLQLFLNPIQFSIQLLASNLTSNLLANWLAIANFPLSLNLN